MRSSWRNWAATARWSTTQARLERDAFDPFFDHLILVDRRRDPAGLDHVIGAYRVLPGDRRAAAGGSIPKAEYRPEPASASGRELLELGRSCVHADHRGGTAMFHLWNGLADYVLDRGIEVLFGVASFHGTDIARAGAAAVLPVPPPSCAARHAGACPAAAAAGDGPDPGGPAGPPSGDGGDPGADQGLPAAGRLCRRRCLDRPRLQHHRRLPGDGHRRRCRPATASSTSARQGRA